MADGDAIDLDVHMLSAIADDLEHIEREVRFPITIVQQVAAVLQRGGLHVELGALTTFEGRLNLLAREAGEIKRSIERRREAARKEA